MRQYAQYHLRASHVFLNTRVVCDVDLISLDESYNVNLYSDPTHEVQVRRVEAQFGVKAWDIHICSLTRV